VSDGRVIASAKDVRKLATALELYKKDVSDASKKVRGALNAAYFHDARKTQFDARYRDHEKRINGFLSAEVDDMVRSLRNLAAKLDELNNIRM
jgi:hypothetical protein